MKTKALFWTGGAAAVIAARLSHAGILWPEEGLPIAAAVQMLQGKALYRDIWFDKPPLVPAFYILFGASTGIPLRVAGALYVLAACWLVYRFGRDLWGEQEGAAAALLLGFFLTFGIPSAIMALAADLLTLAPHIAALWLVSRGRPLAAGVAAGIAFQCNTKAAFVLAVCALWQWRRLPRLAAGFVLPNAAILAWLAAQGSLSAYYDQVWRLGVIYARDSFLGNPVREGLFRTLNWMGFHAALVLGAAVFFIRNAGDRPAGLDASDGARPRPATSERAGFAVWLMLALTCVIAGWRFFPRYYLHLLPVLTLAAARGFKLLGPSRVRVLMLAALLVPLVRFGPRYVLIAAGRSAFWSDTAMDRNSREAARAVLTRARPADTLFVWGYRPDIYAYTRMRAATRFLESQPLTGVFADRHLFDARASYADWAAQNRRELMQGRPAFVVDGIAPYNPALAIDQYADLRPWLSHYRVIARTGAAVIYSRHD